MIFFGAWTVEALMNICFPLCATMGFVPHPFSLLSGLVSSENLFSSFIVEESEADDFSVCFVGIGNEVEKFANPK
jgi:hypothetical protein